MTSFLGSKSAKARNARNSLVGVQRIPDDPFQSDREKLEDFKRTVSVTIDGVKEFCNSTEKNSSTVSNHELISQLQEFYGSGENERFRKSRDIVCASSTAYDCSVGKLNDVRARLEQLQSQTRDALKKLDERDKAYWEKEHYENKMGRLSDDERMDGELVDRNVKKMSRAITDFAETDRFLREARSLASGSGETLDMILIQYSRCLSTLFTPGMQKLFEKSARLRGWKEQVVGVERIKDDPFENDRRELEEYESVIRLVHSSTRKFHDSLGLASRSHSEMMGALKRFHELNENVSQRKRIDAIDIAVDAIGEEFDQGKDQMEQVSRKLEALLAMHTGLGERLKERDKAHGAKVHYEAKIQELNSKETDIEKIERNKKKQKEATFEYEQKEQVTVRECRDALNTKYKDIDQILGLYVKMVGEYFIHVSEKFSKVVPLTDDMITSVVRGSERNDLGLPSLREMEKKEENSDTESDLLTPLRPN